MPPRSYQGSGCFSRSVFGHSGSAKANNIPWRFAPVTRVVMRFDEAERGTSEAPAGSGREARPNKTPRTRTAEGLSDKHEQEKGNCGKRSSLTTTNLLGNLTLNKLHCCNRT